MTPETRLHEIVQAAQRLLDDQAEPSRDAATFWRDVELVSRFAQHVIVDLPRHAPWTAA